MNKPITATAVEKMRRWAKQRVRTTALPYGQALEEAARNAGFASWHQVQEASKAAAPPPDAFDLPVDPELPPDFEQTANEDRSRAELDEWWLRPFAQSRPDGTLDVRCLDGGCWDRPTYYGTAKDLAEARLLARTKLDRWQEVRDTPAVLLLNTVCLLTLEPNRPGMPRPVLSAGGGHAEVRELLAQWDETRARDPGAALLALQAARVRSERIPSYNEVEEARRRALAGGLADPDGAPAGVQELALLTTLHAFGRGSGSEVHFTLPEIAHYLWEFGLDQASLDQAFARARKLRLGDRPAIVSANAESRAGLAHWAVRLAPAPWAKKASMARR